MTSSTPTAAPRATVARGGGHGTAHGYVRADGDVRRSRAPDIAKVKPNELGLVPIFVYHLIGDTEGAWTRTPANFRKDLERLYRLGYRTVKLSDFLDGYVDIPRRHQPRRPHVRRQLAEPVPLREGRRQARPAADCAVGMLEAFATNHPDFGHNATFYVLPAADPPHNLFGQDEYQRQKLEYLLANGYELGNHTLWHQNLSSVSDAEVQRQIGEAILWIRKLVPQARLDTFALPQGAWPKNKQLAKTGNTRARPYRNRAIVMAWGEPTYPYDRVEFNAFAIPRIQGVQKMLDLYLDMLDKQPESAT